MGGLKCKVRIDEHRQWKLTVLTSVNNMQKQCKATWFYCCLSRQHIVRSRSRNAGWRNNLAFLQNNTINIKHFKYIPKHWILVYIWQVQLITFHSGSIPKRPMNQNGPRKGQKWPIARSKTALVEVQNGPQLHPKRPTRPDHRPKQQMVLKTVHASFNFIIVPQFSSSDTRPNLVMTLTLLRLRGMRSILTLNSVKKTSPAKHWV